MFVVQHGFGAAWLTMPKRMRIHPAALTYLEQHGFSRYKGRKLWLVRVEDGRNREIIAEAWAIQAKGQMTRRALKLQADPSPLTQFHLPTQKDYD